MELVVDSNIAISAIISSKGKTRELLFLDKIKLFAPHLLLSEIFKHKKEIIKKSGLSENEFNLAVSIILSRINFVSLHGFGSFIKKAKQICPDLNDTEFFALALYKNIPLWSNDKALKKQNRIIVFSTTELLKGFE
ncbi:nucleotide-binding protein [Candidatus Micrarchaeota archaeon]|nr:nucleotide-binding protein [Candidatus Micrarchaeota archaeon]MBU2477120.1 nucleotide-binding protein [Candidatus Micrarchaeota archaeon]